jgi:hypothetical protein
MRLPILLATILFAASTAIAQTQTPAPPQPAPIAISHVTLINPATSSVQRDATVIIEGDHIGTVLIGAMVKMPGNTILIDGHGKFLIPGLWDMHIHSAFDDWFPGGRDIILPLFVANGVTGVRDMGGDLPVLLDWRKQIVAGKIPGPRMIVSGPMLDAVLPSGKLRFPSSIAVTTPAPRAPLSISSSRKAPTSSKRNPSSRTTLISLPPTKPTNKTSSSSATCPTKFASPNLSPPAKKASST